MSRKRNNLSLRRINKYNKHYRSDNVLVAVKKNTSVIFPLQDSKSSYGRTTARSDGSTKSSFQSINCCKTSEHTTQNINYDANSIHNVYFSVDQTSSVDQRPSDAQSAINRKKRRRNTIRKINRFREKRKYLSDHKNTHKLKKTATYSRNKKIARVGALTKINPVIGFDKAEMEETCSPVKLYGNKVCRRTKVSNYLKCLDSPMTRKDPKVLVHYKKNNQLNGNHDIHLKRRISYDNEIYKNMLRKRFLNKTNFYTYSTTPHVYYMINFNNSKKSDYNTSEDVPYITDEFNTCTNISTNNLNKFSNAKQIRPSYLKHKQFAVSDAVVKLSSKCPTWDCKEAMNNNIVLIRNHSEIGLKNVKKSKHFKTKFDTKINKSRKHVRPFMEINLGQTKTNRRKCYKYLKTDSSRHYDTTSIEQLNVIYSDYPEIEKNSSLINLHKSCTYLKRYVGVDTRSFLKVDNNYISSRKRTKTRFKQIKLHNDQRGDENIYRNSESTIEYTDFKPLQLTQRYKSKRKSEPELFEKYETLSQQNSSEDTSTSFGYFDIKENSKVKLKVIYSLNRHKREAGGIVNNLKKFFKGALKCKSEGTSIEPEGNKEKLSQILHVVSSSSLHKIAFGSQRSSSNQYCYFKDIKPHKQKYTKEIGTNVFLTTTPQRKECKNGNFYYKMLEDNTDKMKPDLTKHKVHIKPVQIQLSTEISSVTLENPICIDGFKNNIGRRWSCQTKNIETSSRTARSSSFTHKFGRYNRRSFQQQVRKRATNGQNKNVLKNEENKIYASVHSNLYPRVPYVPSSDIRRRWDDFYIFEPCPRNARLSRTQSSDSPRPKPELKEWIVQPLELKVQNQIKKHTITEKKKSTPQTKFDYYEKLTNYRYLPQYKTGREIRPLLKSNVNDKFRASIGSSTSSFENCIIAYVNSFHNLVHKIKESGLLRIGKKNKKKSKYIDKIPKTLWLKNLSFSSNKKTNKTIGSSKSSIWKHKVHIAEGNTLLEFSDNQEKLFLTDLQLKSVMNRENENTKKIFLKSGILNFDLKEINNGCNIESDRAKTPASSYVYKEDKSENKCIKQMDMNVDATGNEVCIPNNIEKKQIVGKKNQHNIYSDEETNKINNKKNKNVGNYRFPFNKFRHIGNKFTGVKSILMGQKTKNFENKQTKEFITDDNYDKKSKIYKLLSKQKVGMLPNEKEINLQESQAITVYGTENFKGNLYLNAKCISSIDNMTAI